MSDPTGNLQCMKCGSWVWKTERVAAVLQGELVPIGAVLECLECGRVIYWDDEESRVYPTKAEWLASFVETLGGFRPS